MKPFMNNSHHVLHVFIWMDLKLDVSDLELLIIMLCLSFFSGFVKFTFAYIT